MNFLILINSAPGYKYFYHRLGEALKKNGHQIFYAVDARRSCYLEPLPNLDLGNNTIFFDDFFKKHYRVELDEEKFDVTWGEYFFSEFDRFLTHDFNLKRPKDYWVKVRHCLDNFFDNVFFENSIDCVVYENISNSYAYSACQAAKRNGAIYLGLMASRLPGRFEIHSSVIDAELDLIDDMARREVDKKDLDWFHSYSKKIIDVSPDYMAYNGLDNISLSRLFKVQKIKQIYRLLRSYFSTEHYYDYQYGSPLQVLRKGIVINVQRKVSASLSHKYFESDDNIRALSKCEKFYVYPMHFHPESSTSVLAPLYVNEFNNILNIANNLPFGVFLYVKDHRSAYGLQSPAFYKKVSVIPNVRLVSPSFNIKKLICNSLGVISVNSTAGFEALVLGKPAYILGRVFYERFPNVYRLRNFDSLKSALSLEWKGGVEKHIIAYYKYTYSGDVRISRGVEDGDQYFEDLARLLAGRAELSK